MTLTSWPEPNEIVMRVVGGLGNQLYQLGAGLAIGKETNRRVLFDRSADPGLVGQNPRPFLLDQLGHDLAIQNLGEPRRTVWRAALSSRLRGLSAAPLLQSMVGLNVVSENSDFYTLVAEVSQSRKANVLIGYFQYSWAISEAREIAKAALHRFSLDKQAQVVFDHIRSEPHSVALHVRRGDYLLLSNSPTQNPAYYEDAIKQISNVFPGSKFFAFSDDPEWVASWGAKYQNLVPVSCHSQAEPFGDLKLMAECRHFILSHSSFSAWGWILTSKFEDQICIAPSGFFRNFGCDLPLGGAGITELG